MIPLSSIDFAAVLKGARVPLCVSTRSVERAEWIGDAAHAMRRGAMDFTRLVSTEANQRQLALDPADPDVARLLDMRIAESYIPSGPEMGALLWVRDGRFVLLMMGVERFMFRWHNNGRCYSYTNHRTPHMDCPSIPHIATPANIPAARAALIRALYPRTA